MIICRECITPLETSDRGYFCPKCGVVFTTTDGITIFSRDRESLESPFDERFFRINHELEMKHFWFRGRNAAICRLFAKFTRPDMSMIELGCGTGNVMKLLSRRCGRIEGADFFLSALQFARHRLSTTYYVADIKDLPFDGEFDAVGMFDVLEHIDDEVMALANVTQTLKPGGLLFLTVPAGSGLMSDYDRLLHHKRRYDLPPLAKLLQDNGFEIVKISYLNFLLFPIAWYVRRRLQRKSKAGKVGNQTLREYLRVYPVLNTLFYTAMKFESMLIPYINFPVGGSIIAVARRRG